MNSSEKLQNSQGYYKYMMIIWIQFFGQQCERLLPDPSNLEPADCGTAFLFLCEHMTDMSEQQI